MHQKDEKHTEHVCTDLLGGIFKKKRIFAQILLGRLEKVTMEKGERDIRIISPVNSGL